MGDNLPSLPVVLGTETIELFYTENHSNNDCDNFKQPRVYAFLDKRITLIVFFLHIVKT